MLLMQIMRLGTTFLAVIRAIGAPPVKRGLDLFPLLRRKISNFNAGLPRGSALILSQHAFGMCFSPSSFRDSFFFATRHSRGKNLFLVTLIPLPECSTNLFSTITARYFDLVFIVYTPAFATLQYFRWIGRILQASSQISFFFMYMVIRTSFLSMGSIIGIHSSAMLFTVRSKILSRFQPQFLAMCFAIFRHPFGLAFCTKSVFAIFMTRRIMKLIKPFREFALTAGSFGSIQALPPIQALGSVPGS